MEAKAWLFFHKFWCPVDVHITNGKFNKANGTCREPWDEFVLCQVASMFFSCILREVFFVALVAFFSRMAAAVGTQKICR